MEEPEDIAEEFCIHQEDDLKEDVSCAVKTKQEADKLAIELLAMRLECYYIDLCFRTCPGCVSILQGQEDFCVICKACFLPLQSIYSC